MNMGQFRSLVQAATGTKHTHRYRLLDKIITNNAVTEFPILTADDDPDYDEDFDGSSAAPECEVGARVLGIDLSVDLVPGNAGGQHELLIWKSPDGLLSGISIAGSSLFTNDQTSERILFRKYCLAYTRFLSTASRESSRTHVRISRAAMKRAGVMHDTDSLRMAIAATDTAADGTFSMHGRIWTRK